LPVGKLRAKSLPGDTVFDHWRPNPRSGRVGVGVDPSFEAYHRAASAYPETLDVDTAQQGRKHHNHDCGDRNEIGPRALRHEAYKSGSTTAKRCGSIIPRPGRVRSRNDIAAADIEQRYVRCKIAGRNRGAFWCSSPPDSKAVSDTQPTALPSSPTRCRCPPFPSSGIRQGYRTGSGVGVHLCPRLPFRDCGDAQSDQTP
jgi:hypothetical protein